MLANPMSYVKAQILLYRPSCLSDRIILPGQPAAATSRCGSTAAMPCWRHSPIPSGGSSAATFLARAGAKVLGNTEIGACAQIAAGSVVLAPVPAGCTAAGVPARIIGCVDVPEPALEMDQRI